MSTTWLSFSLTPVQRFVEAARTVRDLKAGSRLLSHLTFQAFKAACQASGAPLFPELDPAGPEPPGIPNVFAVEFQDKTTAEQAKTNCREAVMTRWGEIASCVHKKLEQHVRQFRKSGGSVPWDEGWQEQVDTYWDMQTVVLPLDEVTQDSYEAWFGIRPAAIGLAERWKVLQTLLGAEKQVRHFPPDQGSGRHKCTLLGDLEMMGPAGLSESDKFWKEITEQEIQGIYLGQRDRLCAVSLCKRFAAWDTQLRDLKGRIEDTAAIACRHWWQEANRNWREECKVVEMAIAAVQKCLGQDAETERRYLLLDEVTCRTLTRDTRLKNKPESVAQQARELKKARDALFKKAEEGRLGRPPRYFAILALDGDEIGQWLSGGKCNLTTKFHGDMSKALRQYAEGTVPCVVEKDNCGTLVYAGGDDALALLPVHTALGCAKALGDAYPQFGASGADPTTASAGLAILHYAQDLRAGLRAAREAVRAAKEWGRNALGIRVMKRSGAPIALTVKWDDVDRLMKLKRLFECGVTDRWIYRLGLLLPDLEELVEQEAFTVLLKQALKRLELDPKDKARLESELNCPRNDHEDWVHNQVSQIWTELAASRGQRHQELHNRDGGRTARAQLHQQYPLADDAKFPGQAFKAFHDFALVASFLARGRD